MRCLLDATRVCTNTTKGVYPVSVNANLTSDYDHGGRSKDKDIQTRLHFSGSGGLCRCCGKHTSRTYKKQNLAFKYALTEQPQIRLAKLSEATGCNIVGKAEFQNPGGSVKDRAALGVVSDAEEQGSYVA